MDKKLDLISHVKPADPVVVDLVEENNRLKETLKARQDEIQRLLRVIAAWEKTGEVMKLYHTSAIPINGRSVLSPRDLDKK